MIFRNYNSLLQPSNKENFYDSLSKTSGFLFNSLINILEDEKIDYKVKQGFDSLSKDIEINSFNKITLELNDDINVIEKLFEDYAIYDIFNIINKSKQYIFLVKE